MTDGQTKAVQAAVAGSVAKISVKDGVFVKAGEVLIELDPTLYVADVALVDEKIAQLKAELDRLDAERHGTFISGMAADPNRYNAQEVIRRARNSGYQQRLNELRSALASKEAALAAGRTTLIGLQARLAVAKEKVERARPNVDIAISRFQYLQWQSEALELEQNAATQRQTNEQFLRDVEGMRQKLLQITSERITSNVMEVSEKQSLMAQLKTDQEKARKKLSDTVVRAPLDGYVQKVAVTTIGATVNTNDVLVILVPDGAPLTMEVFIPNDDRGFLQTGQRVDIKLDAFPFQKYGRLNGRLDWISPDAELLVDKNISLLTKSSQLKAANNQVQEYVYRGKVSANAHRDGNTPIRLVPGLTGQVDIYTDKRLIIDFFLFPVQKNLEEALRVR